MLSCPLCHRALAGTPARCYACQGDLSALKHLRELADDHFNKGVAAARARQWGTAAEHLVVALVLNPADDEARGLLHKVRLQQRSPSQGRVTARARVRPGVRRRQQRQGPHPRGEGRRL